MENMKVKVEVFEFTFQVLTSIPHLKTTFFILKCTLRAILLHADVNKTKDWTLVQNVALVIDVKELKLG